MLSLHWHIFHDVRTTFFSGTFALCMEIKLKLCFIFARHCDVYFITSQLRYLFVRCTYVFLRRQNYVIFWYVRIMCRNEVTIVFQFCSLLWRIFYYVIYLFNAVTFFYDFSNRFYFGTFELCMEIMLQLRFVFVRHCNVFFITSQLRYLFVRCSYAFWWRYNYVIFW